ncbi:hypothetical protein N7454_002767 [Penicillium verhagenii]|nr:hypothetical protein N7454_002767 [Penicillium verhagenii]
MLLISVDPVDPGQSPFEDAQVVTYPQGYPQSASQPSFEGGDRPSGTSDMRLKLAASRAYTFSLSPHFLYTRSQLISVLISSKVYRQLEFMAVGSWWIHSEDADAKDSGLGATQSFHRVPGNREDIFADTHISMKSKRTLMRFLRHISKTEDAESGEVEEDLSAPFGDYISSEFGVPEDLQNPLLSLSLSQRTLESTSASYAVPRIKRHLASIGALGPGFGGVISKYGGGSEILQVACRASAVGGGVYALDTGIKSITDNESGEDYPVELQLSNGESVRTKVVIGSVWDLYPTHDRSLSCAKFTRSITVVASEFTSLFPVTVEGAPVPASAILMFPGETLNSPQSPPVYLQVHSSDTGDCPRIIYGSVSVTGPEGQTLLGRAVDRLIRAEGPRAAVLWSMRYNQQGRLSNDGSSPTIQTHSPHVYSFPPPSLDLAFEDENIDMVKQAWLKVAGDEDPDDFMIFDDREGTDD